MDREYGHYTKLVAHRSNNYGGTSSGGGTTDPVTLKSTNDAYKNTITDTNAILYGQVDKPKSYAVTKIGIRIRVDGSTYAKGWSRYDNTKSTYTNSTYMYPYFDLNAELNLKLTHATTYYYQFYAVVNGKEYWSAEAKFTTTGKHSYGSWKTTKEATCTASGTKTRTCSCGAKETQTIEALGHSWSTTWSKDDNNHWHICTRCNTKGDKAAHTFKEQVIAPSGSSQGYTLHTCKTCSYSYKDSYTSVNTGCSHKSTKEVVTDATCGKDGKSETVCKDCGETISAKTIPATGAHVWDKGKETTKATCTVSGVITYTCAVCGETKAETSAAFGHSFGAWEVVKEATYTQEGRRSRACELCGETETETMPMLTRPDESGSETVITTTVPETVITTSDPETEDDAPVDDDYDSPVSSDDHIDDDFFGESSSADSTDADVPITLVDEESKIVLSAANGIISDDVQLMVVSDSENRTDTRIVYDITLVDADGDQIQPGGSVTVKIPVSAEWTAQNVFIYRVEDDGTYTDMKAAYDDGYAVFATDHFSIYVLTASAQGDIFADDRPANIGDASDASENNSSVLIYVFVSIIVVLAAAVAVLSVLMVRKRK